MALQQRPPSTLKTRGDAATEYCTRVNQRHFGGKRDNRRHSITSLSENVVVAEISYQMLQDLSFCDRERAQPPLQQGGQKCDLL